MGLHQNKKGQLYLGIDGGGSKCRATLYDSGDRVLGTAVAGRANPLFGVEATLASILAATEGALTEAGLSMAACGDINAGMGLAGVNVPGLMAQMRQWQHPFAHLFITSDLHTACLGAHGGGEGAVIITGTGSCGFAQVGDARLSLGGHGFALGDKGSGAWLGLKAAEQVLLTLDGFGPATALEARLLAHLGVEDALGIVSRLAGQSSATFAAFARDVLETAAAGDAVANAIVTEGGAYISAMAKRLFELQPPRFSMIGGLAEPLRPWLDGDVVARLSPTLAPPEYGAVLYARQQLTQ
ncbi:ATPase [Shewanella cyperi]|uniref:ATPase n=1 Tax=Shewanella cyperi TaxID=2814292 RepID=A0A974XPI1_9GAMM|nr:BadF/BadG/BcrA/BcrD ATPase family protein [Shewanella cyperi]QSX30881.1 ATPase [Shewanella cyperi]